MINSWSQYFTYGKSLKVNSESTGFVYFFGEEKKGEELKKQFLKVVKDHSLDWQKDNLIKNEREQLYFVGKNGPVWILRPSLRIKPNGEHGGIFVESLPHWIRDTAGGLLGHFKTHQLKNIQLNLLGTQPIEDKSLFFSFNVSAYNYKQILDSKYLADLPKVNVYKEGLNIAKECLHSARIEAESLNIARHLINLPPNELNPSTYTMFIKKMKWTKSSKIEIWDYKRLVKEKMGLHIAVGQGSENLPCMVHISYRPKKKSKKAPVAFVGKGITFDTGGLDIKPSAAMRLMKKDMGGSAAVLAVAHWVDAIQYDHPCDFYLGLAENSVDQKSFRPSDVVTARNGIRVEIDNTDAEGRLVLADCLDVAVTQKMKPEVVIDLATLTGAIKVALGAEIAGLFSNNDILAESIHKAGHRSGDLNWRMPLVDKYFGSLSTSFADMKNSADGFGGAITAALFLQKFTKDVPWAHLDIYAWNDKPVGPLSFSGGNGQGVQCLIEWLKAR